MWYNSTTLNKKNPMNKIASSLFFSKKINQLGSAISSVFICVFFMAFTSPDKKNNAYTNTIFDFLNTGLTTAAGPNDTVDLALVLTTPNTFACPGSQVDFTIEILNQGQTTVESFELTNYVPAGLSLSAT